MPSFSSREDSSLVFPRRLASNCAYPRWVRPVTLGGTSLLLLTFVQHTALLIITVVQHSMTYRECLRRLEHLYLIKRYFGAELLHFEHRAAQHTRVLLIGIIYNPLTTRRQKYVTDRRSENIHILNMEES